MGLGFFFRSKPEIYAGYAEKHSKGEFEGHYYSCLRVGFSPDVHAFACVLLFCDTFYLKPCKLSEIRAELGAAVLQVRICTL